MIRRGSIRGRLVAALVLVVLVAAGVLAVGMVVMLRAERDFRALAQDRIPAVALAGELAEATGGLAALAMQMVADPAMSVARMDRAIANAAQGVEGVLASPLWQTAPDRAPTRAGIESAERDLRRALTGFGRISADLARRAQAEAQAGADLRWAHSDVQDQVQGILADLSFNMDTQLAALVANPHGRATAERALSQDWLLRDRVQQIGAAAATLTALLLQARAADGLAALEQTAALGGDTLDRLALAQLNLPDRVDVRLLIQALDRLRALATGEDSIFAQARERLVRHRAAVAELQAAQAALAGMQALLTDLGRAERIGAQARADAAAVAIRRGSVWLGLVAALGAVATAVILAIFVHKRILLRIEALSADLARIAGSDAVPPRAPGDEIAGMARAVEVFRASVLARQQALERLEMTQRELVQAGKMAALGQMSAAISHEINQPLAAIGHRLHNLRAAHPAADPAIARIEALLERITRTIGHLRRIARRSEHRNSRVLLVEPVRAALDLLDHRLRTEGVRVDCADLDGLAVAGDEILLEQVLVNILGNALDAIAARDGAVAPGVIDIALTGGDPMGPDPVWLVIRDNGVGLGDHSGPALTDPFVTTKEPGRGLGLGLSIAFNVMQDMGGHLEIEPRAEGGAEVRLRLNRWAGG